MFRKPFILVLCGSFLFLLCVPNSHACSCVTPEVREAFRAASAVFVGEVTEIVEPRTSNAKAPLVDRLYGVKFKVERSWKGRTSQEIIVLSDQGRAGCFSWGPFLKGSKYLVYAERRTPAGRPIRELAVLFSCNRTALLAGASQDLKVLETITLKGHLTKAVISIDQTVSTAEQKWLCSADTRTTSMFSYPAEPCTTSRKRRWIGCYTSRRFAS